MGYSVKEVVNNINNKWFLPAIQRPYVWGSRHEEEKYICRLFDSILRGYPIGLLILWKPEKLVPFREFVGDYEEDYSFKPLNPQKIISALNITFACFPKSILRAFRSI